MMTPTAGRLGWMVQKNRHLIDALMLRRGPEFVRRRSPGPLAGDVPVFTFHAVIPEVFEEQCRHLVRNGYRTLSAAEFRAHLCGEEPADGPAVVLTFDDGMKHVWTVAHPILEKHGLRAICFLVPGCIPAGDDRVRPTVADVWAGEVAEEEVVGIREGEPSLATWAEIRRMRAAGTFDFHSHTMYHTLVPTSDRVFDFVGPHYDPYFFGNIHVPVYRLDGEDVLARDPMPGLPVFYAHPRMQAERRFIPDDGLIEACVGLAREGGGRGFFERSDWRRLLHGAVEAYGRREGQLGRFETTEERDREVLEELVASRHAIEEHLPGTTVDHLCFPWYEGLPFAVEAAREAGFLVTYVGTRADRSTNRPGQDAIGVVRVEELFLERLPGTGRKSLVDLARRMLADRSLPARLFPEREVGAERSSDAA